MARTGEDVKTDKGTDGQGTDSICKGRKRDEGDGGCRGGEADALGG